LYRTIDKLVAAIMQSAERRSVPSPESQAILGTQVIHSSEQQSGARWSACAILRCCSTWTAATATPSQQSHSGLDDIKAITYETGWCLDDLIGCSFCRSTRCRTRASVFRQLSGFGGFWQRDDAYWCAAPCCAAVASRFTGTKGESRRPSSSSSFVSSSVILHLRHCQPRPWAGPEC
jgi:hypothetical protein